MGFKLIRVDKEEANKIQLAVGKHIIGRGTFLHNDETDKRVSRKHAELEVTDDSLTLKALHQNPCFYILKHSGKGTEILQASSSVSLCNGDRFGLVPENFWYEVVYCTGLELLEKRIEVENSNKANREKTEEDEVDHTVVKSEPEENDVTACASNNKEDATINFDMEDEAEQSNRSASPSVLNTEPMDQESTEDYVPDIQPQTNSTPTTPNKRCHDEPEDASPVDVKKVKTEPVTPNAQPGPSNDQAVSNDDSKDQKPNIAGPASPAKPPAPPARERCMYGASCYRRNPQHKAQFSHPSDSDWGDGDRGVCPYGNTCRKTDPRHWQQNEHPPGVRPPGPNMNRPGQKKRAKQRKASESEEDDDDGDSSTADLIVTGKRARKTVNRDVWQDTQSDEDEDPYKTDESDEWQPSSDFTNSDFSQRF